MRRWTRQEAASFSVDRLRGEPRPRKQERSAAAERGYRRHLALVSGARLVARLKTGRTGLFEGHSTARLAVVTAAALAVADLQPGVRCKQAQALGERHVTAGQISQARPRTRPGTLVRAIAHAWPCYPPTDNHWRRPLSAAGGSSAGLAGRPARPNQVNRHGSRTVVSSATGASWYRMHRIVGVPITAANVRDSNQSFVSAVANVCLKRCAWTWKPTSFSYRSISAPMPNRVFDPPRSLTSSLDTPPGPR